MTSERKLLISTLKLTKTGPIAKEFISKDAGIPAEIADRILKKIHQQNLIQHRDNIVEASSTQRINIAIQALKFGADLESISRFLQWIEFENITAKAFEANNFSAKKRFRFKWAGRRWEIDVLACREPLIVCVECKHWRRGWGRSAVAKAVGVQVERTRALSSKLPLLYEKVELPGWKRAIVVPVVLSLVLGSLKFYNNTPIVPILQLQNFLDELPAQLEILTHFVVRFR